MAPAGLSRGLTFGNVSRAADREGSRDDAATAADEACLCWRTRRSMSARSKAGTKARAKAKSESKHGRVGDVTYHA